MHDLVPGDPAAADAATQEWLRELCRRADEVLWSSYRFAMEAPGAPWPRVMFPRKGQVRRVGEQEARFAFVAALLGEPGPEPWAFAAEVPTKLSYRFAHRGSGEKAQRALTDLALYRHGHDEPALAVEFKSGGRSGKVRARREHPQRTSPGSSPSSPTRSGSTSCAAPAVRRSPDSCAPWTRRSRASAAPRG